MLSLFPELLFLAPLSATLLRAALAVTLAMSAWRRAATENNLERTIGLLEVGIAIALVAGAWTQAAAMLAAALLAYTLLSPRYRTMPKSTAALALAISVSLLVTGPGAFSFDLPL